MVKKRVRTYRKGPRRYFKKSLGRYVQPKTSIRSNVISVKCSNVDSIFLAADMEEYRLGRTTADYVNMQTYLQTSAEFSRKGVEYSYYKINGVSFTANRRWLDPISYGVNGTSPGFTQTSFPRGLEECSLNFFPAFTGLAGLGIKVANAETSWKIKPYSWLPQRHYISFPTNFTGGSNSNGYGTWNQCGNYTSLPGQLSIFNTGLGVTASNISGIHIWDIEVEIYVSFCNSIGM